MFLAAAALLFHVSIFTPYKLQATEKLIQPTVAKAAEDSAVFAKPESSAPPQKMVWSAWTLSADATAAVAFAPGRLVAEPVVAASPTPASPAASPASPMAIEAAPLRPIYSKPISAVSDRRRQREWLALAIAEHSTATLDAWTTRRVLSSVPQAQEANPFLRPFAGNASVYAAVQVAPAIFDLLSHKMMNSPYCWARHTWWLPQAVSAAVSLTSGVHNLGVYHSR